MTNTPQTSDRQIRVFISSTFRDMQEERDELVKKIFPQLRKMCEERAVTWTEVDLRWGITTEQSAEGKVLPLCLEEIQRCRPYFIGMLGERYGWVPEPDSIPAELLETQPWLKEHLDHSVTELEILHGVLGDKQMEGHSYFYFRDPRYIDTIPHSERSDFIAEDPEAAEKLGNLKHKIRAASAEKVCELREGYTDPDELGEWILKDFTKLIDRLYPKEETPDPLAQEAARHESYARSRRMGFVGREELISQLDEHSSSPNDPLVLTGESGCGKSALLAEWAARWRKSHPEDFVIQHYIGSTSNSAEWQGVVRRILGELKSSFDITEDIPTDTDALRNALLDWMAKAAGSRKVVVVLDALNQLADNDAGRQLGWLPRVYPPNLRIILSTLPGESLEALEKRGWPQMNVPLFTRADIGPAALAYFSIFSKTPPKEIITQLEETPAACNALYLRAVLDELRQFGKHEELQAKADGYLSAPDLPELFDRILTRWDEDYGSEDEHTDLVREAMCLIAYSRNGLSEGELLDLLGNEDGPLPHRYWTPLYLAAEQSLSINAGLLNFGHAYLREAVNDRWLSNEETMNAYHLRLAEYFDRQKVGPRKAAELPWQLQAAGERDRLRECLLDIPMFLALHERNENELLGYWVWLGEEREMGELYLESFALWSTHQDNGHLSVVANRLGLFLSEGALYAEAEPLERRALAFAEQAHGTRHPHVATCLNNLALLLQATNRLEEAEPLYRRAVEIDEQALGSEHPNMARDLNSLASLLQGMNRFAEAEPLFRHALAISEQSYGTEHSTVAIRLNGLAGLLTDTDRWAEAEPLYRRSLAITERTYGPDHPAVAANLNNLAGLLRTTNRLAEAEPLYRRTLATTEQVYGMKHPNVAACISNLVMLLYDSNRWAEAEPLVRRALAIIEQSYGAVHPTVAKGLNNLAVLLGATNRLEEAERAYRRALAIIEQSYDTEHSMVANGLHNLAVLLGTTNRLAEAEPLYRRALAIHEQSFGSEHPHVARDLNDLAQLLKAMNRLAEAEPLMRRVLAIDERSYGAEHPDVARDLNNLAQLLKATNRPAEADSLMRRTVEIFLKFTQINGRPHSNLEGAINNYATLLQDLGRSDDEVQREINGLMIGYGFSIGLQDGTPSGPSPQLIAIIERLRSDPSKLEEIAANLQTEDPALFRELVEWLQSRP